MLSAYDELMENNRRRIRLLESMARALYREWFVRTCEAGKLPKGWSEERLENALKFVSGNTIGKEDREGSSVPVYGANGIIGQTDRPSNSPPCIVLGKIGSCGSLHRSHVPCWVSNNAFTVLPSKIVSLDIAWHLLNAIDFRQFIGGAANPYMPINNFGHLSVVVPAESEQAKFDAVAAPMSQLQWSLEQNIANLRRTRDLLLPRLLSGQVEVGKDEG
jgi:type I restriction enzyme S subunit